MNKKYLYIILFTAALLISFWVGFFAKHVLVPNGSVDNNDAPQNVKTGPAAQNKTNPKGLTKKQKEELDKLRSIGYLSGYKKAGKKKGVTRYIRPKAYNAPNLYVSAHAPEATLMDMKGKVLHKWFFKDKVKKSGKYAYGRIQKRHWRRVHLLPNGDLLAIFEGLALLKLDKKSNLLWIYSEGPHHDIEVMDDGRIYVLTREAKTIPRIHDSRPVLEDSITILSPEGKRLERVSLIEAFENSYYAPLLKRIKTAGDIFHTNTIEALDGTMADRSPLFKKGNILISIRYLDAVAIVDMDQKRVEWCLTGMWHEQHQPSLLASGNILLFDNNGPITKGLSRILEFDPFTQVIHWSYQADKPGQFYSSSSGSVQRLPNGNTLITESNSGRAFEVTPDKTIVWEFYNPYRSWKDKKLVATLFEVIRLDRTFSTEWLEK